MLGIICVQWSLGDLHSFVRVYPHGCVDNWTTASSVLAMSDCVGCVGMYMRQQQTFSQPVLVSGNVATLPKVQIQFTALCGAPVHTSMQLSVNQWLLVPTTPECTCATGTNRACTQHLASPVSALLSSLASHLAQTMFKCLSSWSPPYLSQPFSSPTSHYNTHSSSTCQLDLLSSRTCFRQKTFSFAGASLWRSLPKNIRTCKDFGAFSRLCEAFLP